MKLFLVVIFLSSSAFAGGPRLCSMRHAHKVISIAEKHSGYDKNRHCAVSCMLALRCNNREVMLIGYLKEFKDLFGKGNAETNDVVADRYGIDLVSHQRARKDRECLVQCDLRY